jgi:uncharacterized protein (DUF4415 family)
MSVNPAPIFDDDNPEWTVADFAESKREGNIPEHILAAFPRTRGRPVGTNKQLVSLRIDRDTIENFRATGPGWQSRINDILRKAASAN